MRTGDVSLVPILLLHVLWVNKKLPHGYNPVDFIVSSNFTFFSFKLLVYSEKICTFAK